MWSKYLKNLLKESSKTLWKTARLFCESSCSTFVQKQLWVCHKLRKFFGTIPNAMTSIWQYVLLCLSLVPSSWTNTDLYFRLEHFSLHIDCDFTQWGERCHSKKGTKGSRNSCYSVSFFLLRHIFSINTMMNSQHHCSVLIRKFIV